MKKLYDRNELLFTIVWILIYVAAQGVSPYLNQIVGIESLFNAAFNIVLTAILFVWIKNAGLMQKYGLCKPAAPASKFLWYLPLVVVSTSNLWYGFKINLPAFDTACYIISMLCVGFLEETIFRGFLFKAIEKKNTTLAILVSSVVFGLAHLLQLLGSYGMELAANLCIVFWAVAFGFMCVIIFYRGASLWPCIISHAAIDVLSVFANENGITTEKRIIFCLIKTAIFVIYTLILLWTLPKKASSRKAE